MHRLRVIKKPTPLAAWIADLASRLAGGTAWIEIENLDPRVVVRVACWVERSFEPAIVFDDPIMDVRAYVYWSAYAAGRGSKGGLITLAPIAGTEDREIRPAGAFRADGQYTQGDVIELRSASDVRFGIRCSDEAGVLPLAGQSLWYSVAAFPANPDIQDEDFERLLQSIVVASSAPFEIEGYMVSPG